MARLPGLASRPLDERPRIGQQPSLNLVEEALKTNCTSACLTQTLV
jgi:hypothetical protein